MIRANVNLARGLSRVQHQFANIQDPVQKSLMAEKCILVDEGDNVVGSETKLDCHSVTPEGSIKLHRAFSAFLFNSKGELLMQQRSEHKVTFPHLWTNTCCSHPLFEEGEMEGIDGVKRAATRRIEYELGITDLEPEDFHYLTRIHYFALSDDKWGEHEIDYILFAQKDVDLNINENEISSVKYVSLDDVKSMNAHSFTPWFKLILETKLPIWWKSIDRLQSFRDHSIIHRL
jgi:isopentenyl-diphosphate delta-isomerase